MGDRAEGAESGLDNVLRNSSISSSKTAFNLESRFRLLSLKLSRNENRQVVVQDSLSLIQPPSPAPILLDGM
ncbi:hypothetical protein DNTS_029888 [Danionella cerebrum]|uniref:Uncharacterized protein n=1 Tax=Danionella cerebrum TaxID=2873325 RepID=A0A553RLN9_9TELE|nr:hypothetical protein DNTS_029888 [Danionella translucida]